MNMIVCGSDCRYQKDGYCCLEGRAVITNAVSSPCCYYQKKKQDRTGESEKRPPDKRGGYA
jgi:hypothetical protein